ncbi:hypothetical protein Tco_0669405 [Tanacetum coccineum]
MSTQFYSSQIKLHFPNPEKSLQFRQVEESESDNLFHDHIQGEDGNAEDVQMADLLRPMEELLQIPIVGIEDAWKLISDKRMKNQAKTDKTNYENGKSVKQKSKIKAKSESQTREVKVKAEAVKEEILKWAHPYPFNGPGQPINVLFEDHFI